MSDMTFNPAPVSAVQEFGVLEGDAAGLVVRTRTGSYRARTALSCLVQPVVGDRVLVAVDAPDTAYLLAVLERPSATPSRLAFTGDVEIVAPSGRVEILARDGIAMNSPQAVGIVAGALEVEAVEGHFAVEQASYSGTWLRACIGSIKLAATSLDAVLDRWTQRVRQSLRRVDELEQLRAQQIDMVARDTLALHGSNTLMTADRLVKVDGQQIHVG